MSLFDLSYCVLSMPDQETSKCHIDLLGGVGGGEGGSSAVTAGEWDEDEEKYSIYKTL